jgi:hypothetical protein
MIAASPEYLDAGKRLARFSHALHTVVRVTAPNEDIMRRALRRFFSFAYRYDDWWLRCFRKNYKLNSAILDPILGIVVIGYERAHRAVSRDDFSAKCLHMYKLARAGLIYLTLAMHHEEQRRERTALPGRSMPMELGHWRDAWKR